MLEMFGGKEPGTLKGVNTFLRDKAPGMMESLVAPVDVGTVPGFGDIYSNFRGNVERELDQQLAGLSETFGARGARYSSGLARQAARTRADAAQRIIGGAVPIREAAAREEFTRRNLGVQGVSTLGGLGLQAADLTQRGRQTAMGFLFADYLRRTSPSQAMDAFANFALNLGSAGQPTTVIS
jgi:hypothetical protein